MFVACCPRRLNLLPMRHHIFLHALALEAVSNPGVLVTLDSTVVITPPDYISPSITVSQKNEQSDTKTLICDLL